jgi:hypothetical protein
VEEIVLVGGSRAALCLLDSFAFLLDHCSGDHWDCSGEIEVKSCKVALSSFQKIRQSTLSDLQF